MQGKDFSSWLSEKLDEPWSAHKFVHLVSDGVLAIVKAKSGSGDFDPSVLMRVLLSWLHFNTPAQAKEMQAGFEDLIKHCLSLRFGAERDAESTQGLNSIVQQKSDWDWVQAISRIMDEMLTAGKNKFELPAEAKVLQELSIEQIAQGVASHLEFVPKDFFPIWLLPPDYQFLDYANLPIAQPSHESAYQHGHFNVIKKISFDEDLPKPLLEASQNEGASTSSTPKMPPVKRTPSFGNSAGSKSNVPRTLNVEKLKLLTGKKREVKVMDSTKMVEMLQESELQRKRLAEEDRESKRQLKEQKRKQEQIEKMKKKEQELEEKRLKKEQEKANKNSSVQDNPRNQSTAAQSNNLAQVESMQAISSHFPGQNIASAAYLPAHMRMLQSSAQGTLQSLSAGSGPAIQNPVQLSHGVQMTNPAAFGGPHMAYVLPQGAQTGQHYAMQPLQGFAIHPQMHGMQQFTPQFHALMTNAGAQDPNSANQMPGITSSVPTLPSPLVHTPQFTPNGSDQEALIQLRGQAQYLSIVSDANKLTAQDKSLIEQFLLGKLTSHPQAEGDFLKVTLSENIFTDPEGQQYREMILFEMTLSRGTWRKLKKRKKIKPVQPSE